MVLLRFTGEPGLSFDKADFDASAARHDSDAISAEVDFEASQGSQDWTGGILAPHDARRADRLPLQGRARTLTLKEVLRVGAR